MNSVISDKMQGFLNYQKALAYVENNQHERALNEIDLALKAEDNPLYYLSKGKILAQQGKFGEAIDVLNKLPDTVEEKNEANFIIQKIKSLESPLGRFTHHLKNQKIVNKLLLFVFFGVSVVFITLYINERQKAILNNNLKNLNQETVEISRQVNMLNTLLKERELVEKEDLEKQKDVLLDSLTGRINSLENKIVSLNNSQKSLTNDLSMKLDSIEKSIESMQLEHN